MKKFLINFICAFIPNRKTRRRFRASFDLAADASNTLTIVDESGTQHSFIISPNLGLNQDYEKLSDKFKLKIHVAETGHNNSVVLHLPIKGNLFINFFNCPHNNKVIIGKRMHINYSLTINHCQSDNYFEIGDNSHIESLSVLSSGNKIVMGDDCLVANAEILGDGHAVFDAETGQCLNLPNGAIEIGNHVWLGRDTLITKNTKIPDNCIVAAKSVCTKKLETPNSLIAGNPAQIKKTGINWDGRSPRDYAASMAGTN